MFLFDDRVGLEKIVNLDHLVNIEVGESSPAHCSVVCRMTDGRQLEVDRATRGDCVKVVVSIYNYLNSQKTMFSMSEVKENALQL